MSSTFEAVIFDCDGVLVDSEVLALEVELDTLSEYGLSYDPDEFAQRYMGMPDAAFFPALAEDFYRRTGRDLPPTFSALHNDRLEAAFRDRLTEVNGALCATRAITIPKAVASSSQQLALAMKLGKVGLLDRFAPHIYSTECVTRGKPAPDLFLHAAGQLGVQPERCLVIEDSANGVIAGRAAGMTVWAFLGGGHCRPASAGALEAAGASRIIADWASFRL